MRIYAVSTGRSFSISARRYPSTHNCSLEKDCSDVINAIFLTPLSNRVLTALYTLLSFLKEMKLQSSPWGSRSTNISRIPLFSSSENRAALSGWQVTTTALRIC